MPYPSALKRFHQITFMPQVVTPAQIPGSLSKRPTSSPAAAPWGSFQRGGRSPRFVSFEGEVQEGETEIPLLACLLDRARPVFSTGRKWGVHCPPPPRCHLPLPAGKLVQRDVIKIRQGNQSRQLRFPQSPFIVLISPQAQACSCGDLRLCQPSLFSQLKKVFMELHIASFY